MNTPQNLKGFRDLLPKQMLIRNKVMSVLKEVFERYGFEPLQTPTLEYADVLLGKYGEEAEKLMYIFDDPGGRKVGLNYDLTVPTARVMSQYQNIPKPFKRYQIQSAYRAENTQKGRYRQFMQCDFDVLGSSSPLSDAEILAVISDVFTKLNLPNFIIKVNSRQILFSLMEKAGIPETMRFPTLQSVDKLDKKPEEEVREELFKKGLSKTQISLLFQCLKDAEPNENLTQIIELAQGLGAKNIMFDPRMVRGLDYYTGMIVETVVTEPKIGSVTGGGRYDTLIQSLGGPEMKAVGASIGMDRVCDVIEELNLWEEMKETATQVLVTIFSPETLSASLDVTTFLRENGINTDIYQDMESKLEKQLKYANQKGIPYVVIIGEDEVKENVVMLKNFQDGTQQKVQKEELLSLLK